MRAHPFMFLFNPHKSQKIHQLRDGTAMSHLISAHEARGLARMPEIFNSKDATWNSGWFSDDWLLTATRLPLSDMKDEQRKIIQRSGSTMENALINRAFAYFAYLERGRATLTREMWKALDLRNRSDIEYYYYKRNCLLFRDFYASADEREEENAVPWHSVGYVLSDQLWAGGPFFRSCFSMDGETNLGFAYLLRTRHPELLDGLGLSIVEITGMVPRERQSLSFVDTWETHVRLDHVRTTTSPPGTMAEACRPPLLCGPDFLAAYEGRWTGQRNDPSVS